MQDRLPISLIVPIFNMGEHAVILWDQLNKNEITSLVQEVLFVNDGSTDDTFLQLQKIQGDLKIISYPQNQGRFKSRLTGALNATAPHLLFIDVRNRLPESFKEQLLFLVSHYENVVGDIHINENESIFSLYWKLSHETIFSHHYSQLKNGPITLTAKNYDEFLKGTTLLYCRRDLFLESCQAMTLLMAHSKIQNDDTHLLKEFVRKTPLMIDQRFYCFWSPRQTYREFLERVWERGPSFVEYHIFKHQGLFFYVTMFTIAYFLVMMSFLFVSLSLFSSFLGTTFALVALTTLAFTRNPISFFQIAFLHTATVICFFLSVLKAIVFYKFRD